jgi:hypothetical protein
MFGERGPNMRITNLKNEVCARYNALTKLIESCQKYLLGCPDGRLRIKRQDKWLSYYIVTDNKNKMGTIIKDISSIKTLAQKAYLEDLVKSAQTEQRILKHLINRYEAPTFEDVYPALSQDRKYLIQPYLTPDDEYKGNWLNKPYKRKGFKEGTPEYMTLKGDRVRSKSEQIIADRLFINNIPYKYECPIMIDGVVYHTDFRILRMSDRKELFYEHFGKMGDEQYANDNIRRINAYSSNGIILGDNFYATFESYENPLDVRVVDNLIKSQFI